MTIDDAPMKLPLYVVVDTSYSMSGSSIHHLSAAISSLIEVSQADPMLADLTLISVISFSNEATVVLPLIEPHEITTLPTLIAGGGTAYGPAIRLLHAQIESDVQNLKRRGNRVYRPTAFFFTDGAPTDDERVWRKSLQELRSSRLYPTVVAVGIGAADPQVLKEVASQPSLAFSTASNVSAAQAIEGFRDLLVSSQRLVTASRSGQSTAEFPVPRHLVRVPI